MKAPGRGAEHLRGAEGAATRAYPLTARLVPEGRAGRRLILAVGRQAGGAAARARVKRVVRAVFAGHREIVQNGQAVLVAVEGDVSRTPRRALRAAARSLFGGLKQRWNMRAPTGGFLGTS